MVVQSEIQWRADIAAERLNFAQSLLDSEPDELDQMRLRDMVLVWGTAARGLGGARSEEDLRNTLSELNALLGQSLDASAFITVNNLVEDLRELIGDSYISIESAARTLDEAVVFLASALSDSEIDVAQDFLASEDAHSSMIGWRIGMAVRNKLRAAGFTEKTLSVANLDDVWYAVLERAVLLRN